MLPRLFRWRPIIERCWSGVLKLYHMKYRGGFEGKVCSKIRKSLQLYGNLCYYTIAERNRLVEQKLWEFYPGEEGAKTILRLRRPRLPHNLTKYELFLASTMEWELLRIIFLSAFMVTILAFTLKTSKLTNCFFYRLLINFFISEIGIIVICFAYITKSFCWTLIDFGFTNTYILFVNNIYKITLIYFINFLILISFFATFIALYSFNGKTIVDKLLRGTLAAIIGLFLIDLSGSFSTLTTKNNYNISFVINNLSGGILGGIIIALLVNILAKEGSCT